MSPSPLAVIFDLGGVLVDWNPRYLYAGLIADPGAREAFLGEICTAEWNLSVDGGRPAAEATAELVDRHPRHEALIRAYFERWIEMVQGPLHDTVPILEALAAKGVPLYALTNWSAETFPLVRDAAGFGFLGHFRRIFVSGELKMVKPDAAIFKHMLAEIGRRPEECLFIDDNGANIAAAEALGFVTHHFSAAPSLRAELERHGLLA